MTKEELFGKIQEVLESDFEIDKSEVKMDSKLFEDLTCFQSSSSTCPESRLTRRCSRTPRLSKT